MISVGALIDQLMESPASAVPDAGAQLVRILSADQVSCEDFLTDPGKLKIPSHLGSRYLAQVALRALRDEYETVDEVLASVQALVDRDPPILEPRKQAAADRIVLPELKILELHQPVRLEDGHWQAAIEGLVTSGPLKDNEVRIRISSRDNPTVCFIVPYLWVHAGIAVYNLLADEPGNFKVCAETFLVVEPLRQVNATSISRSLQCIKPQMDQLRRGKGDVTIHTLKGQLIHMLFDKMLEGGTDLEAVYAEVLPSYLVPLASVTDDFFDENAFRTEVLRHAGMLKVFIEHNPQLLENAQLELKRYSATIGIQGRIDALFRKGAHLDILELKTGKHLRNEDHAQLFIYRLLLSDSIRRWQRNDGQDIQISSRLLSSSDGSFAPLRLTTDFHQVLHARNKLIAVQHALGQTMSHLPPLYEGYSSEVCDNCPSWTRNRCKDATAQFGDRPGAQETAELEYFRRFTRLVQRERWSADQDLADLLDDSRLELRARNFRALRNARVAESEEPFTFHFDHNTSDFERGDSVLIHSGRISSTASYHGYVRDVEPGSLRVSIPLKNISCDVFSGTSWVIDRFPSDVTSEASHTALFDFLVSPDDKVKKAILGDHQPASGSVPGTVRAAETGDVLEQPVGTNRSLNSSQFEAVRRSRNCDPYHLIWGPPGTGKTRVIPEIACRIKGTVLLGAFTNTAVDKMLLALLEADPDWRFLRFGRSADSGAVEAALRSLGKDPADYFTDDLARKQGSVAAVKKALVSAPVVACTAHRASTAPFLRTRSFDMAIVDEAGQLTEPLTLGLIIRARRFVLIGDDRQLPPVVRTRSLGTSLFDRLKRQAERTNAGAVTMLDVQYRMHPLIMEVANRLFYDGRLKSGVDASLRAAPDGDPVRFVPVQADAGADERRNTAEADAIEKLVHDFLHRYHVLPENIGVVSPFRAQVVLLRQRLAGTNVTVDTVERFQGGERDIMILSFVRSRGTGFVFDERRFNVAVTRARLKLVLVAHPDLFRNSKYAWISTFTETPRTAGTT